MKKDTVIYHSGDFDGEFCREIAKMSLLDATYIGWNHGDPPLKFPEEGRVFVCDLPLDTPFGSKEPYDCEKLWDRLVWIDHHRTAIAKTNPDVPGFRMEGVAACRLAWQWFDLHNIAYQYNITPAMPSLAAFKQRRVKEPLAVCLAGEYDVWDHRGDGDLEFQLGLKAEEQIIWNQLLTDSADSAYIQGLISNGCTVLRYQRKRDQSNLRINGHLIQFEGLRFLALNQAGSNSMAFEGATQEGIDGYLTYFFNGHQWFVRMYGLDDRDSDFTPIALRWGGGGHPKACGFETYRLPDFIQVAAKKCCGDCHFWNPLQGSRYTRGLCVQPASPMYQSEGLADDGCAFHVLVGTKD